MKNYKTDMESAGYIFREHWSSDLKHRMFGTFEDYLVFIDLKKDINHVEFWHKEHEWRLKPPYPFSQELLEIESTTCGFCGEIGVNTEELRLVNKIEKCCTKCCEKMKG